MKSPLISQTLVLTAAFVVGGSFCLAAVPYLPGDPLLAVEIAAGSVAVLWATLACLSLMRGHRLGRKLSELSHRQVIGGVAVQVVSGVGRIAVVLGAMRPKIFVGDELLAVLSDDERAAVLLHEDHHRSTRAPIRAAALDAWLSLAGRVERVRHILLDRLADLESMADRHALRKGCDRSALAAALLKTETLDAGSWAVAYGSDRRIRALLDEQSCSFARHRLPYEWLPAAALVMLALACHTWGL